MKKLTRYFSLFERESKLLQKFEEMSFFEVLENTLIYTLHGYMSKSKEEINFEHTKNWKTLSKFLKEIRKKLAPGLTYLDVIENEEKIYSRAWEKMSEEHKKQIKHLAKALWDRGY